MALVTPYCSVGEATVYLQDSDTWNLTDYPAQSQALFWGRVFLDSNYSCVYFDPDTPPDEIKYANALLAEDYLQGTLIETSAKTSGRMTKKRVKAGSVETETEYLPGAVKGDEQDDVNRLISGLCEKKGSTKRIIRG